MLFSSSLSLHTFLYPQYTNGEALVRIPSKGLWNTSDLPFDVLFCSPGFQRDVNGGYETTFDVWNLLPAILRNLPTLSEFKTQLKTFLFRQAFSQTLENHFCANIVFVRLRVFYYVSVRQRVFYYVRVSESLCQRTD